MLKIGFFDTQSPCWVDLFIALKRHSHPGMCSSFIKKSILNIMLQKYKLQR